MRRILALAVGLVVPVVMMSSPAHAQLKCGDRIGRRPEALNHLSTKYHEAPVGVGLATNGGVVEVLSTLDGKTWTIIVTMPNGKSCLIAAGQDWESVEPVATGPKI